MIVRQPKTFTFVRKRTPLGLTIAGRFITLFM